MIAALLQRYLNLYAAGEVYASRIFEMQHLNSKSTLSGLTNLHYRLTLYYMIRLWMCFLKASLYRCLVVNYAVHSIRMRYYRRYISVYIPSRHIQ